MYNLAFYFLLFISYSFFGWVVECIYCSIDQKRICLDRGFLIGPYCPIYGVCAIFMIVVLKKYMSDPIALVLFIMISSAILEYFTSYIMEKVFKVRWWDYSNLPFNIEGRICLIVILGFGILGFLLMYIINPFYSKVILSINQNILIIISFIFFVIFMFDYLLSFTVLSKLKKSFDKMNGDATTIIDSEVRKFLRNKHFFISRLFKAFPSINISLSSGNEILRTINSFISSLELDLKLEKINISKEKLETKKKKLQSSSKKNTSKKIDKIDSKIKSMDKKN